MGLFDKTETSATTVHDVRVVAPVPQKKHFPLCGILMGLVLVGGFAFILMDGARTPPPDVAGRHLAALRNIEQLLALLIAVVFLGLAEIADRMR